MSQFWETGARIWRETKARFVARSQSEPISSVSRLFDFSSSRSAFVAQKKLYGYLKTRMGTRYPSMFEDDVLIRSVNIAKMHVFAACLSDMTVHAVAHAGADGRLDREEKRMMALACYRAGIEEQRDWWPAEEAPASWLEGFEKRIEDVNWENVAAGADCFTESPGALYEWAPVAPHLKRLDEEIVRNSVRYAWIEIRQSFRKRLDADAVASDWRGGEG